MHPSQSCWRSIGWFLNNGLAGGLTNHAAHIAVCSWQHGGTSTEGCLRAACCKPNVFSPTAFEEAVGISASTTQIKALDFSGQEWDWSWLQTDWAETRRTKSRIKAWSLGLESATVGEKADDTQVEKIRAVKDIPTKAFDDTAAKGEKCLCWDRAISVMQRDTLHSRERSTGGNGDTRRNLRPFKSVDTVNKLYGNQSQKGTANYLVWPAVWQATQGT